MRNVHVVLTNGVHLRFELQKRPRPLKPPLIWYGPQKQPYDTVIPNGARVYFALAC
jgi:hypothetical protein